MDTSRPPRMVAWAKRSRSLSHDFTVTVLGWHESQGAYMMAFFALAYMISAIPAGWVGERLGGRRVLAAGLLALAVLVACVPLFRSPL